LSLISRCSGNAAEHSRAHAGWEAAHSAAGSSIYACLAGGHLHPRRDRTAPSASHRREQKPQRCLLNSPSRSVPKITFCN